MKLFVSFLLISLLFIFISCEPLPSPSPDVPLSNLKITELGNLKGIPLEYGACIAITTTGQYAGWAQLWFQDDQMTVRMVGVQFHEKRVHDEVLVIPRF